MHNNADICQVYGHATALNLGAHSTYITVCMGESIGTELKKYDIGR